MSDAIGGVVNIALVVFFVALIALYLSFNVNYEKSFNVKNKIIDLYEEYNGRCSARSKCQEEIIKYESSVGYASIKDTKKLVNVKSDSSGNKIKCSDALGFCIRGVNNVTKGYSEGTVAPQEARCYFEITTFVQVQIPLINNLMGLRFFQITGQTQNMNIKIKEGETCQTIQDSL